MIKWVYTKPRDFHAEEIAANEQHLKQVKWMFRIIVLTLFVCTAYLLAFAYFR